MPHAAAARDGRAARAADAIRSALADALALVLPVRCPGCGALDRSVCASCRVELSGPPRLVVRGELRVWAGVPYTGVVRALVRDFKDAGRTDAARALAQPFRRAILAALAETPPGRPIEICTIPSSSAALRERGYRPVERLLEASGLRPSKALRTVRDRLDQAGLDAESRRRNAAAWLGAADVSGRRFLLVDDVLTTGSTVAEAARALAAGGAELVGIAVLAETPLRRSVVTGDVQ